MASMNKLIHGCVHKINCACLHVSFAILLPDRVNDLEILHLKSAAIIRIILIIDNEVPTYGACAY